MSASKHQKQKQKHSPLPGEVKDRLESVVENTGLLYRQIKEGSSRPHHGVILDLSDFHTRFLQCVQRVSGTCTKLSVLFSKPPTPSLGESGALCGMLEQSTLQLVSTCYQLSPRHGRVLSKEVQQATLGVLDGVSTLVKVLVAHGTTGSARLQGTGTVWERCDSVKNLSKDNRAAAVRVFISELHLLKDARSEVEELEANSGLDDDMYDDDDMEMPPLAGDEVSGRLAEMVLSEGSKACGGQGSAAAVAEGPREWSDAEVKLVKPCIRLIQLSSDIVGDACRLVVSHASVESEQLIEELDAAVEGILQLSPMVDDFAEGLSAPVAMKECKELGMKLGVTLQGILDHLKGCHFTREAKKGWNTNEITRSVFDALQELEHS